DILPADGGDGDDEPSNDDDDDGTNDEDPEDEPFEEDDEEEEHSSLADSPDVPIVDLVLSAVETEALEADEPTHAPRSPISIPLSQTRLHRVLLRARVNTLFKDRPDHRRTAMLMDREAMYSRKAWAFSMDRSSAITAHVRTLEIQVAALITQTTSLQTQLTTALGRIEILEARDQEPQEGPAEAGSSC
nr:hypothetical protein [Tanacetum cinerariifolium]